MGSMEGRGGGMKGRGRDVGSMYGETWGGMGMEGRGGYGGTWGVWRDVGGLLEFM